MVVVIRIGMVDCIHDICFHFHDFITLDFVVVVNRISMVAPVVCW